MKDVAISRGADAVALLDSPTFIAQWSDLCDRCPWSTAYQRPAFAHSWYRVYADRFEPILIVAQDSSSLTGILCLAQSTVDDRLVVAGTPQSAYQAWVCDPRDGNEFALAAVIAARARFPHASIEFRHLPPLAPTSWLSDARVASRALLTPKRRPLLRFADLPVDPLQKPNNRKRLKVFRKSGELEFRRLHQPQELESILDELIAFYELRQFAMNGIEPFTSDPLKRPFHLELMRQPNLLHVTTLSVGGRLASAHINIIEPRHVCLNLIAYNPLFGKHSPGKFHMHLLTRMLIAEGCDQVDLTPGGDPYKERFANAHDTAHMLSIFATRRGRMGGFCRASLERGARHALKSLNVHPAKAKAALATAGELTRNARPDRLIGHAMRLIRPRRGLKLFITSVQAMSDAPASPGIVHVNAFVDLMSYRPQPHAVSRQRFLRDAIERLDEGQCCYTQLEDGRLVHVGWLMKRPTEAFVSTRFPGLVLPSRHALVTAMQSLCSADRPDRVAVCLRAMLDDVSNDEGIEHLAFASSDDDDKTGEMFAASTLTFHPLPPPAKVPTSPQPIG